MSKRLQVIVDDGELREARAAARQAGLTLSEWVRQAMRQARRTAAGGDSTRKLDVIRAGATHAFPTADVEQMLAEIESGYLESPGT